MSGAPKVRSMNVEDSELRPVLVPAGNHECMDRKPDLKPLRKIVGAKSMMKEDTSSTPLVSVSHSLRHQMSSPTALRRHELLLSSNFSLTASCSSDASTDSFCSRASTGRIGQGSFSCRKKRGITKPEKNVATLESSSEKKRCSWVTPKTDPTYVAFHDEEWGVHVHDDRKLFELLVLSGALSELTWPAILGKRHIFREVFMNFDPILVAKINEKKLTAPGTSARGLLSEPKLRGVVENARIILKITEEFGSFSHYCWSFVNQKSITGRFRYPRQVPVKTPKADVISKDMVKRGFRSVGPTVIYSFMQSAGMTNDHLVGCFRFEDCRFLNSEGAEGKANKSSEEVIDGERDIVGLDLELVRAMDAVIVS